MNPQPTQSPDILKQNLVRLLQQNGAALCGVADLILSHKVVAAAVPNVFNLVLPRHLPEPFRLPIHDINTNTYQNQ